ncbi:salivary glue protein Sgs-3-like [Paramacrobiotus metropolitanus]|uniref:salivary glue protein Sgs-3-like n=1 Tax=Paramacrobiotus metropolitanus TaxID=2943436 RepID=UPI002445B3E1|nr:salivary glue protein Sgs-3-like [Paramacrobiotus metropolitanus]
MYIVAFVIVIAVGGVCRADTFNVTAINSNGTQTNITTIVNTNDTIPLLTSDTTTTTTTPTTTTTTTTPTTTTTTPTSTTTDTTTTSTTTTTTSTTPTTTTTTPTTTTSSTTTTTTANTGCPDGWSRYRNSCYYTGERFTGVTFYAALAFCRSFGPKAHLIELNDLDEYNHIQNIAHNVSWGDGPWIGMVRMFNDRRFVLPSTNAVTGDPSFNKMIEDIAGNLGTGYNCGGMDKSGNQFGFWSCTPSGSPWCEIDL